MTSAYELPNVDIALLSSLREIETSDEEPTVDELKVYISEDTLNELLSSKGYIEEHLDAYLRFRNRVIVSKHDYKGFHSRYHTCLKLVQALELAKVERSFRSFYDICFAPGAFTEGLFRLYSIDEAYGITLIEKGLEIDRAITSNPKFHIISPHDGNLYNYDNLVEAKAIKVDLVCADGGFETKNENLQSLYIYPLIFCEFVHAVNTLKKGGVFVCKLFDTFDERTVQAIAALSLYFKRVCITKPEESRLVNSERYLVAVDFDSDGLDALSYHLEDILRLNRRSLIFDESMRTLAPEFSEYVSSMNESIAKNQANEIKRVVDECVRLSEGSRTYDYRGRAPARRERTPQNNSNSGAPRDRVRRSSAQRGRWNRGRGYSIKPGTIIFDWE